MGEQEPYYAHFFCLILGLSVALLGCCIHKSTGVAAEVEFNSSHLPPKRSSALQVVRSSSSLSSTSSSQKETETRVTGTASEHQRSHSDLSSRVIGQDINLDSNSDSGSLPIDHLSRREALTFAWQKLPTLSRPRRLVANLQHPLISNSIQQQQQQIVGSSSVSPSSVSPRLIQWPRDPIQYFEGSTLVLSCSLAISGSSLPLRFAWFKHGKPLSSSSSTTRLSLETQAEYSLLRLSDLRASDSGAYSCVVSNALGLEDRASAQVIVNVRLKWLASSSGDDRNLSTSQLEVVRAGRSVSFECAAASQPRPKIRWFRLGMSATSDGRLGSPTGHQFRLSDTQIRSNLFQLEATGSVPTSGPTGDSFQRVEIQATLMSNGNKAELFTNNETGKWRIESSTGSGNHELRSRLFLDRAEPTSAGLYECEVASESIAANINDQLARGAGEEKLRRFFGLIVNVIALGAANTTCNRPWKVGSLITEPVQTIETYFQASNSKLLL